MKIGPCARDDMKCGHYDRVDVIGEGAVDMVYAAYKSMNVYYASGESVTVIDAGFQSSHFQIVYGGCLNLHKITLKRGYGDNSSGNDKCDDMITGGSVTLVVSCLLPSIILTCYGFFRGNTPSPISVTLALQTTEITLAREQF